MKSTPWWVINLLVNLFTLCLQVVSTFVKYPGVEKQYYNIGGELMSKFQELINKLITKKQASTLSEAAQTLKVSDKHDDLFYAYCKSAGMEEIQPGILKIGEDYRLVKVQSIAKKIDHTIT